jgi:hypothetical protein
MKIKCAMNLVNISNSTNATLMMALGSGTGQVQMNANDLGTASKKK